MKLSKLEIEKIADLVRLELSEVEKEKYSHDLTAVLDYVEKLKEVDTSDISVENADILNIYAEDKAEPCEISQEELLKNAPETKEGFIKVKSVLE